MNPKPLTPPVNQGTHKTLPEKKLTYEEFLDWCDEDTWAEWVNGEVIMLSPASDRHQDLNDFLIAILRPFVETRNIGIIRSAPFQMKTGPELPGREPDIIFISVPHRTRLKETYLDGPADLVIEVTSPESGVRDRGEKFYEYEAGGVTEYWLIDPERHQVEFYQLGQDGRYRLAFGGSEGIYYSEVVSGFWLKAEWLWQEPLPKILDILKELRLI